MLSADASWAYHLFTIRALGDLSTKELGKELPSFL